MRNDDSAVEIYGVSHCYHSNVFLGSLVISIHLVEYPLWARWAVSV